MMKDDENKDAPQGDDDKMEKDVDQVEDAPEQDDFSDDVVQNDSGGFDEEEEAQDLKEEYSTENQEESSQLSRFKSMVGSDPKRSMVILLLLVAAIGGIMYYLLYSGSSTTTKSPQGSFAKKKAGQKNLKVSAPQFSSSSELIPSTDVAIDPVAAKAQLDQMLADKAKKDAAQEASKKAPEVTVVKAPTPVAPPQPQAIPKPNFNKVVDVQSEKPDIKTKSASEVKQQTSTRMKSTMLIGGGGQKSTAQTSSRSADSDYVATASAAPLSKVTKVGNMASLITQGKIIETVLETPVNTNYPGPIRALVSKDVYSEKGSNILIPKGSRVIGELAGGYQAGQTKVMIKWDRIIMPSGYDIKVDGAPGVGKLGNIGIDGIVDRQLWNSLGNVALLSAINVGMAKIMEKEFNVGSSTTTSTTSSSGDQTTNSTSSPTQQAAKQGLDDTSSAIKKWVSDNFTTKPYIEVDQGSVVKIFVNSDIQFPKNISTGVDILK